ncbi:MAG TPA: alpha/beta fold hydrolase, partial [Rhizomicrobium sp.]
MRLFCCVVGLATVAAVVSAEAAPPPLEAFGSLPAISRPHLSPDGKHLSAIEPLNGHPTIMVFEVGAAPGTQPIAFTGENWVPRDTMWVNNDRLVGILETERLRNESTGRQLRGFARAVSLSVSGKKPVLLMNNQRLMQINNGTAQVVGVDPNDPDHVLMEAWDWNKELATDTRLVKPDVEFNLYRVSLEDGGADRVGHGTTKTSDWIVNGQGKLAARLDQDTDLRTTVYLNEGGDSWRQGFTYSSAKGEELGVLGVTSSGALAILRYGARDTLGIDSFPLDGSAFGPALFAPANSDVEEYVADDWTNEVVGARYYTDRLETWYLDPKLEAIQKGLEKALPGETVTIVSWDKPREHFLVATEAPREPRVYNLFTHSTGQLVALASQYPTLQAADLGEMKPYNYAAADGTPIHAYLTLPPGRTPKNLPTVIFPHGGPEARDGLDFDWWAQFMASRGYAVLQPNFRGSSGYGWKFVQASFGQWGTGKMQGDVSDGVKKLVADGIADPKRICIVGASYGGYAALAGATFTPDLYTCAISVAGLSDAASLMGNAARLAGANSDAVAYWRSRLGDKASDSAYLGAISPASHAANVRAPVLLIHCAQDLTVPVGQSILEQSALEAAHKDVQFVQIDGDDHYMRQE